jgi:hypothetical protein
MLNLFLIAALSASQGSVVTVDVAGMPPQLRVIRLEASKNGWSITCQGHSGEQGVLRLTAPAGAASDKLTAYFDSRNHLGSNAYLYRDGRPAPVSCDHEPPISSSEKPVYELLFADPSSLKSLLPIAKSCGFGHAYIRETTPTDVTSRLANAHPQWKTLDAGENIIPRNGPLICFMQMGTQPLMLKIRASKRAP